MEGSLNLGDHCMYICLLGVHIHVLESFFHLSVLHWPPQNPASYKPEGKCYHSCSTKATVYYYYTGVIYDNDIIQDMQFVIVCCISLMFLLL